MKKLRSRVDPVLLLTFVLLITFGSVMVFSSSSIMANNRYDNPFYFLMRHFIFLTPGLGLAYLASRIKPEFWRKSWFVLYLMTFVGLVLTLAFGASVGGAKRWLRMGPVGFQFSELAKLALIIALARYLDRHHSQTNKWQGAILYPLMLLLILVLPIVVEPDFGNPLVITMVYFTLLLVAGIPWRHLIFYPAAALPAMGFLIVKSPYRVARLMGFFSVWGSGAATVHKEGAAYQVSQALLALGSGGVLGKGLGDSDLKLHYLPQAHTDFVFPIIGEELGLAGSLLIVILFSLIVIRGLRAAMKAERLFDKLLALGITFVLTYQAAIHMAVTTALAPTKGITLPFISYGGSSLLISCLMAGILLRISRSP